MILSERKLNSRGVKPFIYNNLRRNKNSHSHSIPPCLTPFPATIDPTPLPLIISLFHQALCHSLASPEHLHGMARVKRTPNHMGSLSSELRQQIVSLAAKMK